MTLHLQRELEKLKRMILSLSALVEESVQKSVLSLKNLDTNCAEEVIASDEQVDEREVDLEEECLKILALYQPVAIDLRFIMSVLKINNDLERIADLAVNIAGVTLALSNEARVDEPYDIAYMAHRVKLMLKKALDSLVHMDAASAREVVALDDEVDTLYRESFCLVKESIRKTPEKIDSLLYYLSVARHLERIADLATNIAEDVTYMIEGKIVRHAGG